MSIGYKEAKEQAEKLADELQRAAAKRKPYQSDLYEGNYPRVIQLKHSDGTFFEFHSCLFADVDEDWFVIITEHHGLFVYERDDVEYVKLIKGDKYLHRNEDYGGY